MSDVTAIAVRGNNLPAEVIPLPMKAGSFLPSEAEFEMMKRIAGSAVDAGSGMLPQNIKTPQQAMAVMLAGSELGFTPFASLRQIFPVNGKMELMTQGLVSLVRDRDPTAVFDIVYSDRTGARVRLHRSGHMVADMEWNEEDVKISRQGMRKKVERWEHRDGRNIPVYAKDKDGRFIWEVNEDSPWTTFPRDMYLWNAMKRCVRIGAPDCTNLVPWSPAEMRVIDHDYVQQAQDQEPVGDLHRALVEGKVSPEQVFSDGAPEDDEPPPPPEPSTRRRQAARPTSETVAAPPSDRPADPRDIAEMGQLLVLLKSAMGPAYVPLYRDLANKYSPNDPDRRFRPEALMAGQLAEIMDRLRGELAKTNGPEDPEMTMPEVKPDANEEEEEAIDLGEDDEEDDEDEPAENPEEGDKVQEETK